MVIGCVDQVGEQGLNIARNAALIAGFPLDVCGTTLDRMCGSGQQAANFAAMGVMAGQYECVIAGGVESMTRVPDGRQRAWAPAKGRCRRGSRPSTTSFPRGSPPRWSPSSGASSARSSTSSPPQSHERAGRAIAEGRFAREIAPLALPDGSVFDTDEGVRVPVNREKMAALAPSFKPDGVVTAANSSQISDGAAALLIMSEARAKALGLTPRARIVATALAGVDPDDHAHRAHPGHPAGAQEGRAQLDQIDRFEINEAFASVVLAWERELHPDMERVNVNGGAIALGHPLGCSGAKLMTTLLHELERTEEALRAPDHVHRLRAGDRHHHRAPVGRCVWGRVARGVGDVSRPRAVKEAVSDRSVESWTITYGSEDHRGVRWEVPWGEGRPVPRDGLRGGERGRGWVRSGGTRGGRGGGEWEHGGERAV